MATNFIVRNLTTNDLVFNPEVINISITPLGAIEIDPLNIVGNFEVCEQLGLLVDANRILVYRGTAIYSKSDLATLGGSATHTETIEGADVDIKAVDTVDIEYDQEDKGTSSEYFKVSRKTGVSAIPYITCTGDGTFLVSPEGDVRLVDGNQSGWTQDHLKLSDNSTDWTDFKTTFGEVSILDAIKQAYDAAAGGGVSDWGYLDTTGPSDGGGGNVTPNLVYQLDGTSSQLVERMSTGIDLTAGVSPHVFVSNVPLSSLGNTLANSGSSYDSSGSLFTTALTNAERPTGAVTCEFIGTIYEWTTSASLFSIRDGSSSSNGCSLINLCCKNGYGAMQLFVEYNSIGTDEKQTIDWIAPIGIPMYIALTRNSAGLLYNLYVNGLHIDAITFVNTPYLSAIPSQQLGLLCEYKNSSLRDNDIGGAVSSFRMTVGTEFSQAQVTEVWNSIKPG